MIERCRAVQSRSDPNADPDHAGSGGRHLERRGQESNRSRNNQHQMYPKVFADFSAESSGPRGLELEFRHSDQ